MFSILAQAASPDATAIVGALLRPEIILGSTGLTAWLIYDNIRLRRELDHVNQESRDMAKVSVEALVRMASERKP